MEALLKDFPIVIEIPVAWGDIDALQILNNVVYFRYFQNARIAYFEKIDAFQFMKATEIGVVLASTQCKFKIPINYPDTVFVGARVINMEKDRFLIKHILVSQQHQKIAAEGNALMVAYDFKQNKKTLVPTELKQRIMDLEQRSF
ncbi:MAG: acyl-CoA thioesterase [Candidatus Hermodarchaeota archaeon]